MDRIYGICTNCGDKYCCRGICKEMNDYLVERRKQLQIKTNECLKIHKK